MWTDGPAKQPWLNYYNSYERTHSCFGDDDTDEAGYGEESGMTAAQAAEVAAAIDAAKDAGATPDEQQNIAEGGNRGAAAGYTGDELEQIAAANIDTAFFDDRNTMGVGAGSISGYGSFADPFAESGVGQTSFGSYINDLKDAGAFAAQNFGVTGLISAVARELGITDKEVTPEQVAAKKQELVNAEPEQQISTGPITPDVFDPNANYDFLEDRNIDKELSDYQAGLTREAANKAAIEQQKAFETGGIADQYEVAYQASNPFNNYAAAMEEADAAMFGGNYAGQPDVIELRNVDSQDPEKIIKPPLPVAEAKVVPKTAMEEYFAKVGTPAIPSSFQEYRSYLPPIGPAANADYRRTLALGTPRYQEPSGPNRSIATLAAAYGLTYDEAAKRFAPPSVPKELLDARPTLPVLPTFAASGGGLNSLMRYK